MRRVITVLNKENHLLNYLKSIPEELISYRKIVENTAIKDNSPLKLISGAEIIKDCRGRIVSANFYSVDNELYKQIFFDGDDITAINYYKNEKLSYKEVFDKGYLTSKYIYKKNGSLAYEILYTYNNLHQIVSLCKRNESQEVAIKYSYDSIDRIVSREIFVNSIPISTQQYSYDALNRVVEYKDENQRIVVKSISQKNELLSYSITDKINNEIMIKNHFTDSGYVDTEFTLNGHSTTVKDINYVDNIMLKQPFTSEDDLDLIICGLYCSKVSCISKPDKVDVIARNSMSLIDKNIELKILPISIRKRILYNIATKAKV